MPAPGLRRYRGLLRILPPAFRRAHGEALERTYLDMRADWEEERGEPGASFWLALTVDVCQVSALEWLALLGRTLRSMTTGGGEEKMSEVLGDIRYAVRQLIRQPLYSVVVVLLMALAIAGNAAVFRVFNGLFLKPLPFEAPEQLVDLDETAPAWDLEYVSIMYRDFGSWRAENSSFESMALYDEGGGNFVGEGNPRRVTILLATHDLDDALGLTPLMGRFFDPAEDMPDGPRATLLSQGFWQQEFGGSPDVIGTTISIDGFPIEVVGILPPEARYFGEYDLWLPLRGNPDDAGSWSYNGVGRLRPDVTPEQALADLTAIHKALIDERPVNEITSPVVTPLRDRFLGEYRLGAGFLLGAVGIVLLIACANIAGLMSVRAMARAQEMGIRRAMGAPKGRIVGQLLTESFVLAGIGAAVGAGAGYWGSEFLVQPLAEQFPAFVKFDLDLRFLLFTLAITVSAAVAFGLAPALRAAGTSETGALSNRATSGRKRRRAVSLLVMGEVALALVLLVVGGLSALDVRHLGRTDPGFDALGVVSFRLNLPSQRYEDGAARLSFAERYVEQLEAIPDVEAAAIASSVPLGGHWGWFFSAEDEPPRAEDEANPVVLNRVVSPGYFEALGVQLQAGRAFDSFDGRDEGAPVVIVNETFVRTHLSHLDDPVGARIHPGTGTPGDDAIWWTVVGVTRDVKHYGVDEEMRPGVYQPLAQNPLSAFHMALSTRGDIAPLMTRVREVTAALDVELPVHSVTPLETSLRESLFTRRAMSWLIGIFSTVALLMAIAGIYGVISYSVGQRRQEISIRMAMGAERGKVVREVLVQGMKLVLAGAALGLVLSLAGARLVAGILVGVSSTDPWIYLFVTALLLVVAFVANYLPARRAAGLHPMGALRGE